MRESRFLFFRTNRGSVTVEFSISFILFLFMILFSAEISRLFYISSSLDLAVSEAAKSAKNKEQSDNTTYQSAFLQKLITQRGVLGIFITSNNAVTANVEFSDNISDIITNNMSAVYTDQKLARYTVSYTYSPIFFPIPSLWANTLLSREVIFVQEN
ncbi:TadE/TadG family type IV pilus assembly protein [Yersinia aleksiciae]|uniref:TadE/TadG family type IV pilus assembly protein n=1 Tax=Yersinia aleksiciae TaxID=263819 RepID=UPI0025AB3591|nr:TadE/TadG family type IV pilus assembly protein [Yersinia aleksiciae]MDN0122203.1 TadE/TadG family type IV pilus assembly protein [Yersinia aleksiciae]